MTCSFGGHTDTPNSWASTVIFLAKWWSVAIFLLIGGLFTIDTPYENSPPIRSDGLGYHAWTRAVLDGNLSFCPYLELDLVGALEPQTTIGRCANKYPPGLALLRFPVMAPFTSANGGELRSTSEDRVNQVLSLVAGTVAMTTSIIAAVRLGATRRLANFAALALLFGTNLFHYATYDSSFTHIYSAALVGGLLAIVVRAGVDGRPVRPIEGILVACIVFLLIDIRLLLIAPIVVVAAGLIVAESLQVSVRKFWDVHRWLLVAAGCGGALAMLVQLAYNRYIFGEWRISTYVGEEFMWSRPRQVHVLLSTRRGVFLWSPVMAFALLAIAYTRQRTMLVTVSLATLTLMGVYGFWHSWDLAGGFGHRGFVEVVPIYSAGLAVALSRVGPRLRMLGYLACGLLTLMTLSLMRAYWSGDLGFGGATSGEFFTYSVGRHSIVAHYLEKWF